ncbi:hypothetical protein [Methylobacterium radiotolerans]|uniref:hypothetical protein n=1 Tax=Methylobacterium radiotolerans TaxID=31998 RepID=UPI001F2FD007|nr:hypothetical protein [Methylobacterium radiotolerans]UIY45684.1 hypothetical protein LZ599_31530 [Methylobacterium radiotolerans]
MSSKAQRLDLQVAIIAVEARSVAYTAVLMKRLSQGEEMFEAEQALCREMDVLAALRAHEWTLVEAAQFS